MRVPASVFGLIVVGVVWLAVAQGEGGTALSPAPEFPPDFQWVNSPRSLTLRELRGKVVLLDFWTYGCINCMHVVPDLLRLAAAYPQELVIIGVHSAKYDNESILANVRQAVQRYGMTYPVVNDQDYRIWTAYKVFGWPTQIVIDPEGNILQGFVGENHYERLDRLIADTVALHRRKGTFREGQPWLQGAPQQVEQTPLRYPGKVLADAASSRLFIADTSQHRIVVTDLQGNLLEVIGQGVAGNTDGAYATARFHQPQGMALQDAWLYVADTGNHTIRRVDLQRRVVDTLLGTGEKARDFNVPGHGRRVPLNSPWDVYAHGPYLYIAMAGMHQLWRMHLATAYAEPFSGSSREDLVDGHHSEAALGQPSGINGDGERLYVADSEVNAIRVASLDPYGSITTVAGGGLFTFGDHDGAGREALLQHPLGVAYADGTLYIADTYNHKIKALDLRHGHVRTLAGSGEAGARDGTAAQAQFYEPGGLSVGNDRLYVADTNNHRVRIIDLATQQVSTLSIRGLTPPTVASSDATTNGSDDVVRLGEQLLSAAAPATMRFALEVPVGWKVNTEAPATLTVQATGEAVRVPPTYARHTVQPFDPALIIPLNVQQAGTRGHLKVALTFVVCRTDNQGLCLPQQAAWEIPVRSQTRTTPSALILPYTMPAL